ncbi:odorant receptor 82a-like isoform X2 [Phymastichus coffea]|uniref:odorant receptor 82a-like isoform X2 n=1 Tax=Phymastichus coffea TaxID=108790 RepID=UPI00273BE867|nr:odorant receptor 82a-like isoform X2 [Phymastichus coffea]
MGSGGIEYERLVLPLKLACQAFSCWPYTIHPLYQAFVLVGLLTWVSSCTAELPMLLAGDDVNRTIEASLITLASYMTVVRFLLFSLRREEMLYVLEVMRCDWTSVQDNAEDARLLISKTLGTFRLSKLFMLNTFIAGLAFAVLPALELENCSGEVAEARLGTDARAEQPLQACVKRAAQQAFLAGGDGRAGVLPFGGRYFFNHTRSGSVYAATYAGNALVGGIGCSTIAGATCFSLITTIHASAKFALVRRHFESISHAEWMGRSTGKFRLCVREHQQCIKFAETVERIINLLALAQFVVSTGLLCFAGFQMTMMLKDRARLTKYGSFLNAAVCELFIFSYSGQRLKSESQAVADFAQLTNWVGAYRKSVDIQIVIMRASKACTITAAKFYDMTLEAFLKVLSSSFSYFSVLVAKQDDS